MARCPSCAREQEPRLICPECGAPLGVVLDCFAALELNGEKLAENNKAPELAETVFEVQEQLAELREARAAGGGDELAEQVAERRTELQASMSEAQGELLRNFARWDAEGNASGELTIELKSILSKIAYLRTLIRDVDRELETAKAA